MRDKRLLMLAISVLASVLLTGCSANSVAAGKYVRKDDTSQILTLQSKPSRLFHLTGHFTGKLGGGNYSLQTASGTAEGTFSYVIEEGKDSAQFNLKSSDGTLWSLKEKDYGVLEDRDGHTWKMDEEF